ncbi:MAG: histidine kinase [Lachnospiraceae bacterium]|nr:histidine kinase [Lachnospiraceae bacterium]
MTKNPKYSIKTILAVLVVTLVITLCTGLFYVQRRQKSALFQQTATGYSEVLSSFLSAMDAGFNTVENYLFNTLYESADVETLSYYEDEITRYYAKERIADTLYQIVQLNEYIECVWFFSPDGDESEFLSRNDYTGITLHELLSMQEAILSYLDASSDNTYFQNDYWEWVCVEEQYYLLWITPVGSSYCGAWVSLFYLSELLGDWIQTDDGMELLLCSANGEVLSNTGELSSHLLSSEESWEEYGDYINICQYSEQADIALELFVSKDIILESRSLYTDYLWFFILLASFVVLTILLFQIFIFSPFQDLILEMRTIGMGAPDKRLQENRHFKDVAELSTSINQLLDERQQLNMQIHESELAAHAIQCQYLQVKLKTHFYMNCISIIHAMARTGHTDLIQEFAVCLVDYLRFIQKDTEQFVKLEDELAHVRSYARIQELRFPDLFEYRENISMELYDAQVPALVLLTFMENFIEHGMQPTEKNWIRIEAYYQEEDGKPGMYFLVLDNGKGFLPETLDALEAKEEPEAAEQQHGIGIRNIVSRIQLLYNGQAWIRFSNAPEGGAQIQFWLPLFSAEDE